jgi:hypothetical protein
MNKTIEDAEEILRRDIDRDYIDLLARAALADILEEQGEYREAKAQRLLATGAAILYYDDRPTTPKEVKWDLFAEGLGGTFIDHLLSGFNPSENSPYLEVIKPLEGRNLSRMSFPSQEEAERYLISCQPPG